MIDARGLQCPWPVVRLARAFREGASEVDIFADDLIAGSEIAAFARETGRAVTQVETIFGMGWRVTEPLLRDA